MRKKSVLAVLTMALGIIALLTLGAFHTAVAELESAPKVKFRDIEGNKFKLADCKGKVAIINFWAVWCPPCKMEIPSLMDLYTRYQDKGLMVFGIALDSGEDDAIRKKAEEYKITYPVINGDYSIRRDFGGIRAVPTTLIINQEGKIYKTYMGYREKEIFEKDLQALFGECEGEAAESEKE